jgi:hypothetical protein
MASLETKPMVMRFADLKLAWAYVHLAAAMGFKPIQGKEGRYYTVRTFHPNRASRRLLTQKWARQSCVVYEARRERQLQLFGDEK